MPKFKETINLKITEQIIPLIEKALDMKLFPWQKECLVHEIPFPDICPCLMDISDRQRLREYCSANFYGSKCKYINRQTGYTSAHCIKMALSSGFPLNMRKPEEFSDVPNIHYSRGYYKHMFYDIWHKLKAVGLPVRELNF